MQGSLSLKTKQWLSDIADGKLSMSQRTVRVLEKADGSLTPAIKEAKKQGVHLVRLIDDQGKDLIAGSKQPFTSLC